MKKQLLATTSAAALMLVVQVTGAQASTKVASIFGVYDAQCASFDCTLGTGNTAVLSEPEAATARTPRDTTRRPFHRQPDR